MLFIFKWPANSFRGCIFRTWTSSSNKSELLHSLDVDSKDSLISLSWTFSRKKDSLNWGIRFAQSKQKKHSSLLPISLNCLTLRLTYFLWVHRSQKSHWMAWTLPMGLEQDVHGCLVGPGFKDTSPLRKRHCRLKYVNHCLWFPLKMGFPDL